MIYIEKDQQVFEDKNLRVYSTTGNYDDNYLIEVYDESDPNVVTGSFAAQFVKYGSIVYKFSNIQELGEEILRIDPESAHSMAAYVRMQKELLKQATEGSLENNSLDQVMVAEDLNTENTPVTGESISASSESLTTPAPETVPKNTTSQTPVAETIPAPDPVTETISTTTSSSVLPTEVEVSTTTESLPIDLDITKTTPELEVANSTSTTEI